MPLQMSDTAAWARRVVPKMALMGHARGVLPRLTLLAGKLLATMSRY